MPPKSIGGRPLLLTCANCNSTSGRELDFHISAAAQAAEIAKGARPLDTRFSFGGETITAAIVLTPDNMDIAVQLHRSDPKAYEGIRKAFAVAAANPGPDYSFNITFPDKHDPRRENVAWLRIGYLYAFAALGYNYILRTALNPVRAQIKEPASELLPFLVRRLGDPIPEESVLFVSEPADFRCIAVAVRDRLVVLPDFENPSTVLDRFGGSPHDQWPTTITARAISLPKRPIYLSDRPGKSSQSTSAAKAELPEAAPNDDPSDLDPQSQ